MIQTLRNLSNDFIIENKLVFVSGMFYGTAFLALDIFLAIEKVPIGICLAFGVVSCGFYGLAVYSVKTKAQVALDRFVEDQRSAVELDNIIRR